MKTCYLKNINLSMFTETYGMVLINTGHCFILIKGLTLFLCCSNMDRNSPEMLGCKTI
jgi:hypothetical protein